MPFARLVSSPVCSVCGSAGPLASTSKLLGSASRTETRRGIRGGVARGKRVLQVPKGVTFSLDANPPPLRAGFHPVRAGRRVLTVTGPKGAVTVEVPRFVRSEPPLEGAVGPSELKLSIDDNRVNLQRMMWNTVNSQIGSAIEGVTNMHEAEINLVGVGFRVTREEPPFARKTALPPWLGGVQPKKERPRLVFRIGFPDDRIFEIPEGWQTEIKSPTHLIIRAPDKMKLGNYCTAIRRHRKPEPYNGKGVFVNGETIRRKEIKRR